MLPETGLLNLIYCFFFAINQLQCRSEIGTTPDLEWLKKVSFANGPEIWKSNHLQSQQMAVILSKTI